ncbi:hypothetical protein EG850_09185 [Gulosibacter macacae]|uniref:Cell division protein FtsL n=1 Tax=Gulosibacter macacae TaxID=2488791 RepID=A0A3P3VV99_9MICO|nr:hypothetical protein [Gulosibacter macacae]RRJ86267.1 hypothetical protein EG850_09185 [Gulosibacter macacae]
MSAVAQPRTTATAPAREPAARPRLRLIEGLQPRSLVSGRGVVIALVVLGVIFGVQLALSLVVIQGAYAEDALESQRIELQRERTAAQEQVDALASPQHLAELATGLGMVPSSGTNTLDLATGAVTGSTEGTTARGPINPALVPNSITNGERDAAERTKPATPGGLAPNSAAPAVPSEFELVSPNTR